MFPQLIGFPTAGLKLIMPISLYTFDLNNHIGVDLDSIIVLDVLTGFNCLIQNERDSNLSADLIAF